MPFIVKACSMALLHFPILNSSLNTQAETITYKAGCTILGWQGSCPHKI